MIRRPPRSTQSRSSAASDVYKRQKDQQRTIFQPVAVAIFAMSAAWLGAKGAITADTIRLFLFGLPVLLAGTWLGMQLSGYLNEACLLYTSDAADDLLCVDLG